MTCKKFEGEEGFVAFMCDMGKENVDKEKYDRVCKGNKNLIAENKKLKENLKYYQELAESWMND